jgi:multiple sugar transport system permease protein
VRRRGAGRLLAWIGLGLGAAWSVVPIYLIVASSLKEPRDLFEFAPRLLWRPVLSSYATLWTQWPEFFRALGNSALIAFVAAGLTVALAAPAGWAYSRHRRRALTATALLLLAARMFPPIVITIPLYPVVQRLGLADHAATLVVLYTAFCVSLATWLIKSFVDEVPVEIEEAARVDGCNTRQVLLRVTLPLTMPGLIATFVLALVFGWNEYLFAFLFTATRTKTAPVILSEMLGSATGVEWGPLFAATTLQLIPMLIVVWLVQGALLRGMTAGAVKG